MPQTMCMPPMRAKTVGGPRITVVGGRDESSDDSAHVAAHRHGVDVWGPAQGPSDRLRGTAEAPHCDMAGEHMEAASMADVRQRN